VITLNIPHVERLGPSIPPQTLPPFLSHVICIPVDRRVRANRSGLRSKRARRNSEDFCRRPATSPAAAGPGFEQNVMAERLHAPHAQRPSRILPAPRAKASDRRGLQTRIASACCGWVISPTAMVTSRPCGTRRVSNLKNPAAVS